MLYFGGNLGFPQMSFNVTPHHNINQHLYLNPPSRVYSVHQLSPFRTFFQNKELVLKSARRKQKEKIECLLNIENKCQTSDHMSLFFHFKLLIEFCLSAK